MSLYPNPGNISGLAGLFSHANSVVDSLFTPLVLFVIFVVALMILLYKNYQVSVSFALSSLITFVLGAMLWAAGLLQDRYVIIPLVVTIGCFIWTIFDKD